MSVRILTGHVLDKLAELGPESVHAVITSPPYYGLRSYLTPPQVWGGDESCEHDWQPSPGRVQRQTKPSDTAHQEGFKDAFRNSSRYLDHTADAMQGGGAFCLRCHAWRGELGQEPQLDLFISHLVDVFRAVRRVLRKDGVLFCNIGDSFSAKSLNLAPQRLAIAMRDDGWIVRSVMPWVKRNCMPESVTDRPVTAVEDVILFTKASRYFWDAEAVRRTASNPMSWEEYGEKTGAGKGGWGGEAVNGVLTKYGGSDKHDGGKSHPNGRNFRTSDLFFDSLGLILDEAGDEPEPAPKGKRTWEERKALGESMRRGQEANWTYGGDGIGDRAGAGPGFDSLGLILDEAGDPLALDVNPAGFKEAHFATFPSKLVRPLILAGTSERGACSSCGSPYVRQTDKESKQEQEHWSGAGRANGCQAGGGHFGRTGQWSAKVETVAWRPSCACPDPGPPVPCTVLDCFSGAGTTLLVSDQLGRNAIGIDLNPQYIAMSANRVTNDAPLFAAIETQGPDTPLAPDSPRLGQLVKRQGDRG